MLKNVLQKGLLLFAFALFFIASWCQVKTVTGTFSDDKGMPLSGAGFGSAS